MINKDYITFDTIAEVTAAIYQYLETGDISYINEYQKEIKLSKSIDFSIRTKDEFAASKAVKANKEFMEKRSEAKADEIIIPSSHGVIRMYIFLMSHFGELFCDNGTLIVKDDDRYSGKTSHMNKYVLHLKDQTTYDRLVRGNPTAKDQPYDFTSDFCEQITFYPDGKIVDTTKTAYDSFIGEYKRPFRKFEFKSALWTTGQYLHNSDYVIQITRSGEFIVRNSRDLKIQKDVIFEPAHGAEKYLAAYLSALDFIDKLKKYTEVLSDLDWDRYILD